MGDVIAFPSKRSCFKCAHHSAVLSRCLLFDEAVDSELYAAKDCNGYEMESAR